MIGPEYAVVAARALLGDTRGDEVPAVVWLALLEDETEVGARTAVANTDAVWGEADGGATNIAPIDCGVADDSYLIDQIALFDAETGGDLMLSGALVDPVTGDPEPVAVAEADALVIDVGGFVVAVS